MFNRVQRTLRLLLLFAALCAASCFGSGTGINIAVQPLIGSPEDAVYCHAVLNAITSAQDTIDVLISSVSMDDNPILPALADAARRGVRVRVLLDSSDWAPQITIKNQPSLAYLLQHGIEARFDDPSITLHAKLIIVDQLISALGSTNWNPYAFSEHRQADVIIHSPIIAAFYVDYFNTLWADRVVDQSVSVALPDTFGRERVVVPLAGLPDSNSYARVVLDLLERAERSIHICMYRMSSYPGYGDSLANDLLDALVDAANRGLDVKVLLDDCAYYADSAEANLMSALLLKQRGVEVRFDAPELTTHTKLVVMDEQTVVLGSTNWNYYALQRNCETDIAFVLFPEIALRYERFFQMLWQDGREPGL